MTLADLVPGGLLRGKAEEQGVKAGAIAIDHESERTLALEIGRAHV